MWPRRYQFASGIGVLFVFLFYSSSSGSHPEKESVELGHRIPPINEDHPSRRPISSETTVSLDGGHTPGFTTFAQLYLRNKTFYVVTSHPDSFPSLSYIISQPKDIGPSHDIDPTPQEMQIITPEESKTLLGEDAIVLRGESFIFWDTKQFMAHYYHWWGELILGSVRVYTSQSPTPMSFPEPRRFLLPNIDDSAWRDRAGINGPLMRTTWPNTPIERKDYWDDLASLDQTFVFDRAMIICRAAAHKSPIVNHLSKMIAGSMDFSAPDNFWESVRQRVVKNTVGYIPVISDIGAVLSTPKSALVPIVTYISRQAGQRSLTPEAHEGLVLALEEVAESGLCQFDVVAMEGLTLSKQIEIVARSTIIIGVHGNGLTHQLWMPPSSRSTVIEIFPPKSYLHDYEILARNMQHKHFAIWNDTSLTYPGGKWFDGVTRGEVEQFNARHSIPVHGPTVADIVMLQLTTSK